MNREEAVTSLAASLWTACWQGMLFVGAVWVLCILVPSLPARAKSWLWWLASLKLLLALAWAGIQVPLLPSAEASPLSEIHTRLNQIAPKLLVPEEMRIASEARLYPAPKPADSVATNWLSLSLLAVWGIGVVCVTGSVVRQTLKLRRLVRRAADASASPAGEIARVLGARIGLAHRPRVLCSGEITSPMVAGLFSPVVLIPAGIEASLSEHELTLCIAHELAHIRRRDLILAVAPMLVQTVFFFFPPAWALRKHWELEREAACDAEAIAITEAKPAAYGRLLLKIVATDQRDGFAGALGATANYHTLRKRIMNMKHFVPCPRSMKIAGAAIAGFAFLLAIPWQVTARAASVAGIDNLVVNGGFEDGSNEWIKGSLIGDSPPVGISVDTSTAHTGKSSLQFTRSDPKFFPVATMAQVLPYNGEENIKVTLWAKAQDVHKFTLAVIMQTQDSGKIEWGAYVGDPNDNTGTATVNHDWKKYTKIVKIPSGTKGVVLALEMYGPGTVWIDDVSASYTSEAGSSTPDVEEDPLADVKDVPNLDVQAAGDPNMRYFLIGGKDPAPDSGYKLLVVLPGGDGSANFNPFIRRISKNALPPGYLIAELVAPKWSDDQFNKIVWPTRKQRWEGMKFATEDFIDRVVKEVSKKRKVDAAHVYTLSWSSGGPAAYAASLNVSSIKGSFVAMSVFHPDELPALFNAKGQTYYLFQSPDDKVTPFHQAEIAQSELNKAGAKTTLATYHGGHGWTEDPFGNIRKGIEWLEKTSG